MFAAWPRSAFIAWCAVKRQLSPGTLTCRTWSEVYVSMGPDILNAFIVAAKRATYVGNGRHAEPSRLGSHDLVFSDGDLTYRDSYFGGTDFLGQEVVWNEKTPVWATSYYGYILRPDLIDAMRAGATIRAALQAMYDEGRFLGGFEWSGPNGIYRDSSSGDVTHFRGRECIIVSGCEAYALEYFGGLVKP
jgi:hypothetical protein